MMDLHCHLDLYKEPEKIISRAKDKGLYVLSITTTPSAWKGTCALTRNIPRFKTALGLHPQLAHKRKHELPLFDEYFDEAKYIGEIGLDGSKEYKAYMPEQLEVFKHILKKCASKPTKILSVHSRSAEKLVLDQIEDAGNIGKIILHWYTGSKSQLERAKNLGLWFSIGPAMTLSKNGQKIISYLPKDKILLETDGPFAKVNNKQLEPVDVDIVVTYLASEWQTSSEKVLNILSQNLKNLVQI